MRIIKLDWIQDDGVVRDVWFRELVKPGTLLSDRTIEPIPTMTECIGCLLDFGSRDEIKSEILSHLSPRRALDRSSMWRFEMKEGAPKVLSATGLRSSLAAMTSTIRDLKLNGRVAKHPKKQSKMKRTSIGALSASSVVSIGPSKRSVRANFVPNRSPRIKSPLPKSTHLPT